MEMKKSIALVAMGVGGTLLYQQAKNGNMKRSFNNMKRTVKKTINKTYDDLEDMM